ncbi:MAG: GPP34 family phosphoprotein [Kiritimatiellia bacterium]|nr:GPP34 family phosphoprotein [Kiritimatiellia bacterium]
MNFAEILFLLALDGERGVIRPEMERTLDYALAGAILMDLALQNRIDTDLTCIRPDPGKESRDPLLLRVVNKEPTGDVLLDEVLKELRHKADPRPTREWLIHFFEEGKSIRERVTAQLAARGILNIQEQRRLYFIKTRHYYLADSGEIKTIKARLRELILGDEIPDQREAVLVGLANSCGLFDEILSPEEQARARPRITALRKLDLIGQAMTGIIREIEHSISTEMRPG